MKKIFTLCKDTHPELNLRVEIDGLTIIFTGNKTPDDLLNKLNILYNNHTLVCSCMYPAIYPFIDRIEFYCGGTTQNPEHFYKTINCSAQQINWICKNLTPFINELNTNIKIL